MGEFDVFIVKYFRLALREFIPTLRELAAKATDDQNREELQDLLERYQEIARKIDTYRLNLEDPNRIYQNEPHEIELPFKDSVIQNLFQLTLRLYKKWQGDLERLKAKEQIYITESDKQKLAELKRLIWPLEHLLFQATDIPDKYKPKEPVEFPGEGSGKQATQAQGQEPPRYHPTLMPEDLIKKLSKELRQLCEEFNFTFANGKPIASMLLLRRILPLSIVRKFQSLGRESEILNPQNEYLETKGLLGKVEPLIPKRTYNEIVNYKLLVDSTQHSFTFIPTMSDVEGTAVKIRVLLEELFQ